MVKEVNKEHKNVEMTRKKKRSGIVYFDYSLLAIDNYYFALLVL